jgi:UDP-N-acetylmuramoyl-L-alanyl-D-glutamate--2,6-diaminopimelate ligase
MKDKIKIAITGSKGKTTILKLLESLIVKYYPQKSIITTSSTEGMYYNGEFIREVSAGNYLNTTDNNNTNFEHDYFISEATSYLLGKGFYNNHNPDIAIFTGIEETEHLDVHGSFKNYFRAKKVLFDNLKEDNIAIINMDDEYAKYIVSDCKCRTIISYGRKDNSLFKLFISNISETKMEFSINSNSHSYNFSTCLLGKYNASNIAAAFITGTQIGLEANSIIESIKHLKPYKGRFQRYYLPENRTVIIDYAHTPNSLKEVLQLCRQVYKDKKLICVFGCGGGKSIKKRPLMGNISTDLSDFVYITSDNSRFEEKKKIIDDIESEINKSNYKAIVERDEAIEEAILQNPNSVILIAGKGAEKIRKESTKALEVECPACKHHFQKELPHKIEKKIEESDCDTLFKIVNKNKFSILDANLSYDVKIIDSN